MAKKSFQVVGAPELAGALPRYPVIGYCRRSLNRDGMQEITLGAQADAIRRYCQLHSLPDPLIIQESASAKDLKGRPEFRKILQMCEAGQVDHLIVTEITRLSRDIGDTRQVFDALEQAKVEVHGATTRIDSTTADGKFMRDLGALLGERERRLIGERTRTALRAKMAKGEYVGQEPYFGYRYVGPRKKRKLVVYEPEQATLRLIRDLLLEGKRNGEIRMELFRRRITPRRGGSTAYSAEQMWRLMKRARETFNLENPHGKAKKNGTQSNGSAGDGGAR